MLHNWFRVFKYDGVTIQDISLQNQDSSIQKNSDLTTTDYLYIAQNYPFNNFFYWLDTANATSTNMKIEYWCGTSWKDAVDVLDSSEAFSKSGSIQFTPNRDYTWQIIDDTSKTNAPTELNPLFVYDCYWIRISFDNNLDVGTKFKKLSYSFTSTEKIKEIDIESDGYFESFATGKTEWIKEILTASELVVQKLKQMGVVVHHGNILRFEDVSMTTVFKTLELIYSNLGRSYADRKNEMIKMFNESLTLNKKFSLDVNDNGHLEKKEINLKSKRLIR